MGPTLRLWADGYLGDAIAEDGIKSINGFHISLASVLPSVANLRLWPTASLIVKVLCGALLAVGAATDYLWEQQPISCGSGNQLAVGAATN